MNTNTRQKAANTASKSKKSVCAAERRYRNAIFKIRAVGRSQISKQEQVDIAYHINTVESYGFGFFPNHYVFDNIVALESIATTLTAQ